MESRFYYVWRLIRHHLHVLQLEWHQFATWSKGTPLHGYRFWEWELVYWARGVLWFKSFIFILYVIYLLLYVSQPTLASHSSEQPVLALVMGIQQVGWLRMLCPLLCLLSGWLEIDWPALHWLVLQSLQRLWLERCGRSGNQSRLWWALGSQSGFRPIDK